MERLRATLGSLVFTIVVPGTVAGLVPWLITRWQTGDHLSNEMVVRAVGIVLIAAGLPILLLAIYRFAVEGVGTPAPIAPTDNLVVGGPNRFVRNPMYLSVVSIIVGQSLLLARADLLGYGVLVAVGQALFVRFYEEPALRRRFGAEYDNYRRHVPAWIPRRTAWRPVE